MPDTGLTPGLWTPESMQRLAIVLEWCGGALLVESIYPITGIRKFMTWLWGTGYADKQGVVLILASALPLAFTVLAAYLMDSIGIDLNWKGSFTVVAAALIIAYFIMYFPAITKDDNESAKKGLQILGIGLVSAGLGISYISTFWPPA